MTRAHMTLALSRSTEEEGADIMKQQSGERHNESSAPSLYWPSPAVLVSHWKGAQSSTSHLTPRQLKRCAVRLGTLAADSRRQQSVKHK
jgi:hypothetical protein